MTSQENTLCKKLSKNLLKFFLTLQEIPNVTQKALLTGIAYLIITFGQPAFLPWVGALAATCGFALFLLQIVNLSPLKRFISGFTFFFLVQAIQLWWLTSHPFYYIWAVYFIVCALMGLQFGLLSLSASRNCLSSIRGSLFLAGLWTLLEWSRLWWLSGFYFDLIGQYLVTNSFTIQMSALFGTLGLSFWVMLTNCLVAYAYLMRPQKRALVFALLACITPYLFGALHLWYHSRSQKAHDLLHPPITSAIVHSKKLPDEMLQGLTSSPLERAFESWQDVIYALAPYKGKKFDLILLPEAVVPFSSLSLIYPKDLMDAIFQDALDTPIQSSEEEYVCSEEIAKTVAFAFNSPVIIGLEGSHTSSRIDRPKFFNSAFCFTGPNLPHLRYDKQILVPMGEYIPFPWAKKLAEPYGIFDSFTPGTTSKLFYVGQHRIGPSICYEETFSSLMRQNKLLGATLFVNLTDDYWFPNSRLGIQHFEHSRARTVENGVPLLRSCNFGISGAIDSLGRSVLAVEGTPYLSASIATVSSYHYDTLYAKWGDTPLIVLSLFFFIVYIFKQTSTRKKAPRI